MWFEGPIIKSETEFKYVEGAIPYMEYADGRDEKWPYCIKSANIGIKSGDTVKIRPSKCFKGIFSSSHNYKLYWEGRWHRIQLII